MTSPLEDAAAFNAFLLGIRVMYIAFDMEAPATEFEKPFDILKELAEGKLTIAAPAELAARFPQFKDFIYDRASSIIERDKETAASVLRGLGAGL